MRKAVVAFGVAMAAVAYGGDVDLSAPDTSVRWIAPSGKIQELDWSYKFEWVLKGKQGDSFRPLALRAFVQVPEKTELLSTSGGSVNQKPKDSPLSGKVVSFDVSSRSAKRSFRFKSQGKTNEFGFFVQIKDPKPFLWVSDSCGDEDISVTEKKTGGKHLFVGVNCAVQKNYIDVFVQHSSKASMSADLTGAKRTGGPLHRSYRFSKAKRPKKGPRQIGRATVRNSGSSRYVLTWGGDPEKNVFSWSAAMGPSFLSYTETPLGIDYTEFAWTVKFFATYKFNSKFDIGANTFVNAVTFMQSPAGTSAQFIGFNLRGGYTYPKKLGKWSLKASLGWYIWSMLVADASFGIEKLFGPQVFISGHLKNPGGRAAWTYLKYAPISDSLSNFSLNNSEFAVGGGYQMKFGFLKNFFHALTLDVAFLSFQSPVFLNKISLTSVSAGLQVRFK